jgi:hypothetical protein
VASIPVGRGDGTFREVAARVAAAAIVVLLAGVVNGWPSLVPLAVAVAGGTYAAELALDDAPVDASAPAIAVGLFLAAELAYWSLDERERIASEEGESLRRAAFVAMLALGAFLAGATVLALADAFGGEGVALDLVGAAAAVAALFAIAAATLTERRAHPTD